MSDNYDTTEMSKALETVATNIPSRINAEAAALAREKGWIEPQKYNYEQYIQDPTVKSQGGVDRTDNPGWFSNAVKYEWNDDFGDIGPENKELEAQLFGDQYINRQGDKFSSLQSIEVFAESRERPAPVRSFADAGLHPVIMENIDRCRFMVPTPIQGYSIPAIKTGHDLIAIAQTGSGKTAAFLIPVLSELMGKAKKLAAARPNLGAGYDPQKDAVVAEPLVLIVAPTRELATQIFDEARRLCYRSMLRPCVVYGGAPVREQREELQKGCDLLIGTPGRLLDFMAKPHVLSFKRVRYTIIDEADELLHDDWEDDFKRLMSGGDINEDADHRYMMFSATFNKACRQLARTYLSDDHVRIRIGRPGSSHMNVDQQVIWVDAHKKRQALYDMLMSMPPSRTLIFVNSKSQADLIDDFLYNQGLPSTSIHADRTQREREDALRAFRTAKCPILVATGVSARGLDVKNVMHVINYDLPRQDYGGIDEYIHRIGRTARIGNEGLATSFYNERDEELAPYLVKILVECKQPVPDFLENYRPELGERLDWDDDTSEEGHSSDEAKDKDDNSVAHVAAETSEEAGIPIGASNPSNSGDWN